MRRRHSLDVWPAFADLMTVLAVVGLFTTLALTYEGESKETLIAKLRERERQLRELQDRLDRQERKWKAEENRWAKEKTLLQGKVQEAARNEQMFKAIQEVQQFIDTISSGSGLTFGADQSLQFGDDLVSFNLNSVVPIWKSGGIERLRVFCQALSSQLASPLPDQGSPSLFIVQVEGHTDSLGCPGDPNCNWWISSGRAANFVALMRNPNYCPGGNRLALRPVGFADSKPVTPYASPSRRIAVRLVPNYEQIIAGLD